MIAIQSCTHETIYKYQDTLQQHSFVIIYTTKLHYIDHDATV